MAVCVRTEKELAQAVEDKVDEIEIEGDLGGKVYKIKAVGNVAWVIAIGAIGVAVLAIMAAPGTIGLSTPAAVAAMAAPAAIIGMPTTIACVSIAVAAGGIGILNSLRDYNLEKRNGKIFLIK